METIIPEGGAGIITSDQLKSLEEAGFGIMGKEGLVDIKAVAIDASLDKTERIIGYINEVRNPYLFKVGDTPVRVKYAESPTLQQAVTKLFINT